MRFRVMRLPQRNVISARVLFFVSCCAACLLFQRCANMQPPGGGPRDLAPPQIVETDPPNSTAGITPKTITLRFDKYVDKRTVQDAIFISPALHGKLKFSWSGKTVEITLPDSLRPNTTYNISFGTDIADLREHVHLAKPFNFTFSTGATLDTGRIKGIVYSKDPAGAFVFAYTSAGRNIDTLNPAHTQPDFIAAVAKDSTFTIPALPVGTFRMLAIRDEQRNLVYDIGTDGYATARADAHIVSQDSAHNTVAGVVFNLALPSDTIPPEIISVKALTNNHLLAESTEPFDSTTITPVRFTIIDSATKSLLRVRSVVPSSKKTGVEIFTDTMPANVKYIFYADSLRDRAANYMKKDTASYTSFDKRDTAAPIVAFPFRDSTVDVNDSVLKFVFDKPVHKDAAQSAIYLFDSTRKTMPLHFTWIDDIMLYAKPDSLMSYAWYTLVAEVQKFTDLYGYHTKDSLVRIKFRTYDVRNNGVMKGEIRDSTNTTGAPYIVTLTNVKTKSLILYTIPKPGAYTATHIPDGTYIIEAFRDDQRTGKYFAGNPYPYKFAEPYFLFGQAVRIRARWSVEGVNIVFPNP